MKKLLVLLLGCVCGFAHSSAILKHREHNGVGYDTGYTTAELFLAPAWKNNFMPFLDLRGHVFDDARFASNMGVGLRYSWNDTSAVGGNVYFDYRDAKNLHPFQFAGGLEFLSTYFDVRLNGYGPFSDTTYSKTSFAGFGGNGALFEQRIKAALPVVEGELGVPLGSRCNNLNWYAALGSYYLFERTVNTVDLGDAVGGRGRLVADYKSIFSFGMDATYDKIFKWTVQGTAGIRIPLGPRGKKAPHAFTCQARNQLPQRQEIIPIDCGSRNITPSFNIVFVNNTSSSNGTFESPYPTLALAEANSKPGDIIYVFPGDGTTMGMDGGIALQSRQTLHGSGSPLIVDGFIIPAHTPGQMPNIENINPAGDAIFLADQNTVTGIHIVSAAGNGINGPAAASSRYLIVDNIIDNVAMHGINYTPSADGAIALVRNTVTNAAMNGIFISSGSTSQFSCLLRGNSCSSNGNIGVLLNVSDESNLDIHMKNNSSTNNAQLGIEINGFDNSTVTAFVSSNTSNFNGNSGILIQSLQAPAVLNQTTIVNNTFDSNGFRSLEYNLNSGSSFTSSVIQNNVMRNNAENVLLRTDSNVLFCTNFTGNFSDNNYTFTQFTGTVFQIVGSDAAEVQSKNFGSVPDPISIPNGANFVPSCQ